tara:strand:- start:208 stop:1056 length:849 start_codon:yes stop_codon:yes gene_type:complete
MLTDALEEIAGDQWNIVGLMGEGVDPHLYRPTSSDVKLLNRARFIFANGLHLEGRLLDSLKKLSKNQKNVLFVGEHLPSEKLLFAEKDIVDPHIWMDASLWHHVYEEIAFVLCDIDPLMCDEYQHRADVFIDNLLRLDAAIKIAIKTIKPKGRVLVTAHDAFQYYGNAYGIRVRGLQGINTEAEAGLKDVSMLVDFLVENKIPAVFVESSVPTRQIEAVVEGALSKGWTVNIGKELFSDSMGKRGTAEGTYLGMMISNTKSIVESLGGDSKGLLSFNIDSNK